MGRPENQGVYIKAVLCHTSHATNNIFPVKCMATSTLGSMVFFLYSKPANQISGSVHMQYDIKFVNLSSILQTRQRVFLWKQVKESNLIRLALCFIS